MDLLDGKVAVYRYQSGTFKGWVIVIFIAILILLYSQDVEKFYILKPKQNCSSPLVQQRVKENIVGSGKARGLEWEVMFSSLYLDVPFPEED